VEERLPRNPLLVQPVERVGLYGGTWRMGIKPSNDAGLLIRTIGYENLVRWDPHWIRVVPNVAQSVEVNDDSTAYIFHLREGMRWSDGAPFTADDIMFWYEDLFLNAALTPSKPSWLVAGGEPVVVEKLDDTTVRFRFAAPYGLFLQQIAQPDIGDMLTDHPRHYLQQFHLDYNPKGIEALIAEAGMADWVELFHLKSADLADRYINPDLPTLHAWVMTNNFEQAGAELMAERPPEAVQQQMALYNQVKATGDPDEQNALFNQLLDIAAEQFYEIGTSLPSDGYGIVKNNFYNVPAVMPAAWSYPHPAPTNPEQYFLEQQE
jgi:peptide/nickel transport system substrate-binding protein